MKTKLLWVVSIDEGKVMKLVHLCLLVCILEIAIQHLVISLMLFQEVVNNPLLLIKIPSFLIMNVNFIVFVLELSEVFEVNVSRIKDLLSLGINKYDLLVLLELLAALNILFAILFTHVYRFDFGLGLLDLLHDQGPFFLWRERGQRLMKQGLGLIGKSRVWVFPWTEF